MTDAPSVRVVRYGHNPVRIRVTMHALGETEDVLPDLDSADMDAAVQLAERFLRSKGVRCGAWHWSGPDLAETFPTFPASSR